MDEGDNTIRFLPKNTVCELTHSSECRISTFYISYLITHLCIAHIFSEQRVNLW